MKEKILIHFDTDHVSTYLLKSEKLEVVCRESVNFNEYLMNEMLLRRIDEVFERLERYVKVFNNEITRIYATGIFQNFNQIEQSKLVVYIYVNYGVYFNIIQPDLELFYLKKSWSLYGSSHMMDGLIQQEFRKVVICGSFQQHLNEIGNIMHILQKRDIKVLSPWTTKVVPETIGTDFILLEGQESLKNARDAWKHKLEHMDKFRQSDAIIICNPGGLVGIGTTFEFGFMVAIAKRIIFIDRPKDLSIPFPYEVGLNFG